LITFSEDFTGYGTSQASVLAGATIAPDGTPSGFKIVEDTSNNQHGINAGPAVSSGVTYTGSYYIKAAERTQAEIIFFGGSATGGSVIGSSFNLVNGTVTNSTASTTSTIVSAGNGWWRCSVTYTTVGAGLMNVNVFSSTSTTVGGRTYQGNGTSGIFAWGAQLEAASSMGNYTPTPANFSTAPSLLLNFANAAVVDSAGANNLLTGNNATITSANKYGSGALTFGGSTDKLQMASSPQFNFGTGDFTVEAWINPTTVNAWQVIFKTSSDTSWSGGVTLALNNGVGSGVRFRVGTAFVDSATSITPNTWTHVAITRNNASCRIFLNGKLDASLSNIETADAQTTPTVGNETSGSSYPYIGSIDDLRVTKGLARYTSDFTPPARALPETGGDSFVTTNVNAGVVQRFTATGTTSWTAPSDVTQVEVLVVAGGAGGASGGGGAGGLIYNNSYPVTPGQTYTVTVGAGLTGNGTLGNNISIAFATNSNGYGTRYVSTSSPSGGQDGDIWYQI
jgi:hypothetical protein